MVYVCHQTIENILRVPKLMSIFRNCHFMCTAIFSRTFAICILVSMLVSMKSWFQRVGQTQGLHLYANINQWMLYYICIYLSSGCFRIVLAAIQAFWRICQASAKWFPWAPSRSKCEVPGYVAGMMANKKTWDPRIHSLFVQHHFADSSWSFAHFHRWSV